MCLLPRRFGLHVVSCLPWSYGPGGLSRALNLAQAAGFMGLQLFPIFGMTDGDLQMLKDEYVISYEEGWFPGPGERWPRASIWLTAHLASGPRFVADYNWHLIREHLKHKAIYSTHHYNGTDPVEIYPELDMSEADLLACPSLVWDTYHIRRAGRYGERPKVRDWRKFLFHLDGAQIHLIHVHLTAAEIDLILLGQAYELQEMLITLQSKTICPVIVEVAPTLTTYSEAVRRLSRILQAVERYIPRYKG